MSILETKVEFMGYINVYPTGLGQLSSSKDVADRRTVDSGKLATIEVYYNHKTKQITAKTL